MPEHPDVGRLCATTGGRVIFQILEERVMEDLFSYSDCTLLRGILSVFQLSKERSIHQIQWALADPSL
jgi:hypothetical protein